MFKPSFKQAEDLSAEYSIIPISREMYADMITPIQALKAVMTVSSKCYLLESVEGGEKWGRYSFIGFDPVIEVRCKDGILNVNGAESPSKQTNKPSDFIRNILKEFKSPRLPYLPPFTGGFVGYFAYEYAKYTEPKLNFFSKSNGDFDDMDLMLFDKVIAFDHLRQKITIIINIKSDNLKISYKNAIDEIESLIGLMKSRAFEKSVGVQLKSPFCSGLTQADYRGLADKVKEHIKDGYIFNAVLSNCHYASFEGSLFNTYRVLRTTNPSPYMFYLNFGETEITGASPETLIKLKDGELSAYPISGTKPRGESDEIDSNTENQLLQDEKEISKHNMLVDLCRSDLGKISDFGTIHVKDYMKVQKYSYVMHLSSVIAGNLKKGLDAFDAIDAVLPSGTLSGMPKISALNLINALENSPRGIYGGAIGYMDFTGNMDICTAMQMCVKKDSKVYVQAGESIDWDSDSDVEYIKAVNKAKALTKAVEIAGEVKD